MVWWRYGEGLPSRRLHEASRIRMGVLRLDVMDGGSAGAQADGERGFISTVEGASVIETTFQFGKVSKLLLHASYLDLRGARMTLLLRSSLSNMLPIAEHQQH